MKLYNIIDHIGTERKEKYTPSLSYSSSSVEAEMNIRQKCDFEIKIFPDNPGAERSQ